MSNTRADEIIKRYIDAYRALYGKEPIITRHGGWYRINGGITAWRLLDLDRMAATLEQRQQDRGEET